MIEACFPNTTYYYDENAKSAGCAGGTAPTPAEPVPEGPPMCEDLGSPNTLTRIDEDHFKYVNGYRTDIYASGEARELISFEGRLALIDWWLANTQGGMECRSHYDGSDDAQIGIISLSEGFSESEICQVNLDNNQSVFFNFAWTTFDVSYTSLSCEGTYYNFIE